MNPEIEKYIHDVLVELTPYLDDIVIVGGICSAFYHVLQEREIPEGLYSTDLDVGVLGDVRRDSPTISECLTRADLKEREVPYFRDIFITKFVPGQNVERVEQSEEFFEVEFLLPLTGPAEKRCDQVGMIQGEIVCERLRYLDLALHNPLKRTIGLRGQEFEVLVPNPGNFIIHKLLSSEKRAEFDKEKKDYGYILNTIDLFGTDGDLEIMAEAVHNAYNCSGEWAAWVKKALKKLSRGFLGEDAELLVYGLEKNPMPGREYARELVRKFYNRCRELIGDSCR